MTEHNLGKWTPGLSKGRTFTINDQIVAVFNIDGELFAIDDFCPHVGGSLGDGKVEGKLVVCPLHDWKFDLTNGDCVAPEEELCNGWIVDTYPVKFEHDEIILSLPS